MGFSPWVHKELGMTKQLIHNLVYLFIEPNSCPLSSHTAKPVTNTRSL